MNCETKNELVISEKPDWIAGYRLYDYSATSLWQYMYSTFPSSIKADDLDPEKVLGLLQKEAAELIYTAEETEPYEENSSWATSVFKLETISYPRLLVKVNHNKTKAMVNIVGTSLSKMHLLRKELQKFKKKKKETQIGLLVSSNGSVEVNKMDFSSPKVDVKLSYGEDFEKIHNKIVSKLKENKSGLYLFHGGVGTGKTTYIKTLTGLVNRLFIFVPTNMVESLVGPNLISVLINQTDCVLVLEDAEKAITSRENLESNQSLVSTLLNLSDGILGSILNTSIIVTFNTDKSQIDKALLRKGRLMVEHEFKGLNKEDAVKLATHLKKDVSKITSDMSLADIYNIEEENFHKDDKKGAIGFGKP